MKEEENTMEKNFNLIDFLRKIIKEKEEEIEQKLEELAELKAELKEKEHYQAPEDTGVEY